MTFSTHGENKDLFRVHDMRDRSVQVHALLYNALWHMACRR